MGQMIRTLKTFGVGYFVGLNGVGLSYWNAVSSPMKIAALWLMMALFVASIVDEYVAPRYVKSDTDD